MRASPFSELDIEASDKHQALVSRVRHFAEDRPLKGLVDADDADGVAAVHPWDDGVADGDSSAPE